MELPGVPPDWMSKPDPRCPEAEGGRLKEGIWIQHCNLKIFLEWETFCYLEFVKVVSLKNPERTYETVHK